ncbi:hypothetical protein F4801DRAFT_561836 [Xylaria longipes]|nr:hypothetical protein F4801DRAFT_561836 [Xylaria longipes]
MLLQDIHWPLIKSAVVTVTSYTQFAPPSRACFLMSVRTSSTPVSTPGVSCDLADLAMLYYESDDSSRVALRLCPKDKPNGKIAHCTVGCLTNRQLHRPLWADLPARRQMRIPSHLLGQVSRL